VWIFFFKKKMGVGDGAASRGREQRAFLRVHFLFLLLFLVA
jgi:hypothetical protein